VDYFKTLFLAKKLSYVLDNFFQNSEDISTDAWKKKWYNRNLRGFRTIFLLLQTAWPWEFGNNRKNCHLFTDVENSLHYIFIKENYVYSETSQVPIEGLSP
jgi:hypothetical protein